MTGLVAEISHRYRPDRIELESPDFMGFAHGYHHEKDGMGLLPEETFLLGVCFCPHCMARATAAGVPAEGARATVAAMLDAAFARELPEAQVPGFPEEGIDAFRGMARPPRFPRLAAGAGDLARRGNQGGRASRHAHPSHRLRGKLVGRRRSGGLRRRLRRHPPLRLLHARGPPRPADGARRGRCSPPARR